MDLLLSRHIGVAGRLAMSCVWWSLFYVFVFFGSLNGNDYDFRIIDAIHLEQSCSAAGGMCTIAADCPSGQLSEQKGLCPDQRSQGIECCYGISMKETRCAKRGGVCFSQAQNYCNPQLVFNDATDCMDGQLCCIMV